MPEISQLAINQGIQGRVMQLGGDYMPGNTNLPSGRHNDSIQTKIWIFAGQILGTGSPRWAIEAAADHPGLMLQVESDRDGYYAVSLPSGEYTVFAQQENYLYLNVFQGNGRFKSVTVAANRVTKLDLTNTENAFF